MIALFLPLLFCWIIQQFIGCDLFTFVYAQFAFQSIMFRYAHTMHRNQIEWNSKLNNDPCLLIFRIFLFIQSIHLGIIRLKNSIVGQRKNVGNILHAIRSPNTTQIPGELTWPTYNFIFKFSRQSGGDFSFSVDNIISTYSQRLSNDWELLLSNLSRIRLSLSALSSADVVVFSRYVPIWLCPRDDVRGKRGCLFCDTYTQFSF